MSATIKIDKPRPTRNKKITSITELARETGISRRTLEGWVQDQRIEKDVDKKLGEYWDLLKVYDTAIALNIEREGQDRDTPDQKIEKLLKLRAERETAEFKLSVLKGFYLKKEEVEQLNTLKILTLKQSLLSLPTSLAQRLAITNTPSEVQSILKERIEQLIMSYANQKTIDDDIIKNEQILEEEDNDDDL